MGNQVRCFGVGNEYVINDKVGLFDMFVDVYFVVVYCVDISGYYISQVVQVVEVDIYNSDLCIEFGCYFSCLCVDYVIVQNEYMAWFYVWYVVQ